MRGGYPASISACTKAFEFLRILTIWLCHARPKAQWFEPERLPVCCGCLNEYSDVFLFNSMKFLGLVLLCFLLLLSWFLNALQAKERRVARLSCAMFKRPVVAAGDGFVVGHYLDMSVWKATLSIYHCKLYWIIEEETGHSQWLRCAWCCWHGSGIW